MIEQRSIVLTALIVAIFLSGGAFYYFSRSNDTQPAVEATETPESAELAAELNEADATSAEEQEKPEEQEKALENEPSQEPLVVAENTNNQTPEEENNQPAATSAKEQENKETGPVGGYNEHGKILAAQDVSPTAATGFSTLFIFAVALAFLVSLNAVISLSRNY